MSCRKKGQHLKVKAPSRRMRRVSLTCARLYPPWVAGTEARAVAQQGRASPTGWSMDTTQAAVRGNPATDRRPAAEASADMTPAVIAAIGLNRRPLDTRQLPSDRLLAPDRALTGSRKHRVPHPGWPLRVVWITLPLNARWCYRL